MRPPLTGISSFRNDVLEHMNEHLLFGAEFLLSEVLDRPVEFVLVHWYSDDCG